MGMPSTGLTHLTAGQMAVVSIGVLLVAYVLSMQAFTGFTTSSQIQSLPYAVCNESIISLAADAWVAVSTETPSNECLSQAQTLCEMATPSRIQELQKKCSQFCQAYFPMCTGHLVPNSWNGNCPLSPETSSITFSQTASDAIYSCQVFNGSLQGICRCTR